MFIGVHSLIFTKDAEAARAFFRDVLEFPWVNAGDGGWCSRCRLPRSACTGGRRSRPRAASALRRHSRHGGPPAGQGRQADRTDPRRRVGHRDQDRGSRRRLDWHLSAQAPPRVRAGAAAGGVAGGPDCPVAQAAGTLGDSFPAGPTLHAARATGHPSPRRQPNDPRLACPSPRRPCPSAARTWPGPRQPWWRRWDPCPRARNSAPAESAAPCPARSRCVRRCAWG